MIPRRRKKKQVEEGPFLFSEEEMLGMIENVTVIETPIPENRNVSGTSSNEAKVQPEENTSTDNLSSDERIICAMKDVLRRMADMRKNEIRRIAFTITIICEQGMNLDKSYNIPVLNKGEITGYELAAWCYCTFSEAFPTMKDKIHLPYAEHYEKAKEIAGTQILCKGRIK